MGPVLSGLYLSTDTQPCDAENLLFYNVGASQFKQATRWGLRFERSDKPPPTEPGAPSYEHYYRYEFVPSERPFQHWPHLRVLACWTEVPCPIRSSNSSPAQIWWTYPALVDRVTLTDSGFADHLLSNSSGDRYPRAECRLLRL